METCANHDLRPDLFAEGRKENEIRSSWTGNRDATRCNLWLDFIRLRSINVAYAILGVCSRTRDLKDKRYEYILVDSTFLV
jgi:hypothetical protein